MPKAFLSFLLLTFSSQLIAQPGPSIRVTVMSENKSALPGSTVYLLTADSVIFRTAATNAEGITEFTGIDARRYRLKASATGHEESFSQWIDLEKDPSFIGTIVLKQKTGTLQNVTVVSKKPFVEFRADKTVINPEANVTNAGANVVDLLEKSPGITINKDGGIIMKGKPSVTVLIDGKPTQLSGADLHAYLSGISASQVELLELIENPGAKYDASGNAGIINIKTKANKVKGFNGSMNLSIGQGKYSKTGNSLNLNYREGKINWFMNYGNRASTDFQDIWTLRKYFDKNGQDSALLEQPNMGKHKVAGHNIKTGFDFFASQKTTLGLVFNGGLLDRRGKSESTISWMDRNYKVDSTIATLGETNLEFKRAGVTLSGRHKIDDRTEVDFDLDYVKFNIASDQNYQTQSNTPGSPVMATRGNTPSKLNIVSFKVDYTKRLKGVTLETGLKTALNKTDNLADYYSFNGTNWVQDLSRSNHFLYDEKISAAYASADAKKGKWHWQGGVRYEYTSYDAHQLGNAIVKDSAFNKNYSSFFPTAFVSYEADSNNIFTFRTGRRIDRPPFQQLNPFLKTLNKYTYESGNPFIRPQYTWNFGLGHTYKQKLTTEISYSYLKDYFSQIFVIDSSSSNVDRNIILYTRGNVGSFENYGASITYQQAVTEWWSIMGVSGFNYKIIKGVVWAPFTAKIKQLNVSLNNQFKFKKGWGAEISGYYQTKSQIDLQEWLEPQGSLDLGISKQILQGKGSLKLSVRDVTYFQNYSGFATFQNSYEPFEIKWDSRVVRLNFSWRFGKSMKAISRSEGGAAEEINRVGGN